jgi:hypothetical protein
MEFWVDGTQLYSTFGSSELDATAGISPGPHILTYYIVNAAGTKWMKPVTINLR